MSIFRVFLILVVSTCLCAGVMGQIYPPAGADTLPGPLPTPWAAVPGPPTTNDDGRYMALTLNTATVGDSDLNFHLRVPDTEVQVILWIFDGEKTNSIPGASLWDVPGPTSNTYYLYADADLDGTPDGAALASLSSSSGLLVDNQWSVVFVESTGGGGHPAAVDGFFNYLVRASWDAASAQNEANRMKLTAQPPATISTVPETIVGFIGFNDIAPAPGLGFPGLDTDYDGTFSFGGPFPEEMCTLDLWDGDFDVEDDTDQPNTPPFPPFPVSSGALPEGANPGNPPDDPAVPDWTTNAPNVNYTITGPGGVITNNTNPSGNSEFERFRACSDNPLCVDPGNCEVNLASLPSGNYTLDVAGLDHFNTIYFLFEGSPVPPPFEACEPGNKITELVFQYVGGDCSGSDNDQDSNKWDCSGDPGGSPVSITITKKSGERTATPSNGINVGDLITFTTTNDWFKGDLEFDVTGGGGTQSLQLHVSCSQPLATGDQFGSMLLVGLTFK